MRYLVTLGVLIFGFVASPAQAQIVDIAHIDLRAGAPSFAASTTALKRVTLQSLPTTKSLQWSQSDATTAQVTSYTVTYDGTPTTLPPCTPDPTQCSQNVTFTTVGQHVFTVTAVNAWGAGPAASLTVNVVVPGKSSNLVIK